MGAGRCVDCSSLYAAKTGSVPFVSNSPVLESETTKLIKCVYPNPSRDMLIVEFSEMPIKMDVEIHSSTGVLVYKSSVVEEQKFALTEVNWPNGSYFITVNNGMKIETLPWVLMR